MSENVKPEYSPIQKQMLEECKALAMFLISKNTNYGSSAFEPPILMPSQTPNIAVQIRMSDKIKRMRELLSGDKDVVNESLNDTIRDLAGYCIIWMINDRLEKTSPRKE